MIQRSWVQITVLRVMGSHMLYFYYVHGASEGTRNMESLVLGHVLRQVKERRQSGPISYFPGLPAFNEDLAIEVQ